MQRILGVMIFGSASVLGVSTSASSADCNLTTAGASCTVTGTVGGVALLQQIDPQSTGTGVIDPFLRVQNTNGGLPNVEDGFNTSCCNGGSIPDDDKAGTWTHDLSTLDVPVVNVGGTDYAQFLLDINQTASDPMLSLDEIRIYQSDTASITNDATLFAQTLIWDLNDADEIFLNYGLNPGSGAGDAFLYIPLAAFDLDLDFVYLYNIFGASPTCPLAFCGLQRQGIWNFNFYSATANSGFEEWATLEGDTLSEVPEPATLLLFGTGRSVSSGRRVVGSPVELTKGLSVSSENSLSSPGARSGERVAAIGPLLVAGDKPYTARYMEAVFPPGAQPAGHRCPKFARFIL